MHLRHLFFLSHNLQPLLVRPTLDSEPLGPSGWPSSDSLTSLTHPPFSHVHATYCRLLPKATLVLSSAPLIVLQRLYGISFLLLFPCLSFPTPLSTVAQCFLLPGACTAFHKGLWQAYRCPASLGPSSVPSYVKPHCKDSLPGLSSPFLAKITEVRAKPFPLFPYTVWRILGP